MRSIEKTALERMIELGAELLGTKSRPVVMPGEAILGIEALARSLSCPGRSFLNIVTGPYGAQFGMWLKEGGADVTDLSCGYNQVISAESVSQAVSDAKAAGKPFDCIAYVHTEAVTGGLNPVEAIQKIAKREGLYTILDSVSAVGADPFRMDDWGVDFVSAGYQKALSGPNGISLIGISPRGLAWMQENPKAVRHSVMSVLDTYEAELYSVPLTLSCLDFEAALAALEAVHAEGLDRLEERHRKAAELVRKTAVEMGYQLWQESEAGCTSLDTVLVRPNTCAMQEFRGEGIVREGDGALRTRVLRINHYGEDCCEASIEAAFETLRKFAG